MQVRHFLPAFRTGIDDKSEPPFRTRRTPLFFRQFGSQYRDFTQQFRIGLGHVLHGRDVALWNDHEMNRRCRVDVVERVQLIVLEHFARMNLSLDDLAKNTVAHGKNYSFLEAFSASPDRPSRLASSARTCTGRKL